MDGQAGLEDKSDDTADEDDKEDHTPLSDKIHRLQERQQLYEGYLTELSDTRQTQKLTTDPEARMMHSHVKKDISDKMRSSTNPVFF